MRKHAHTFQTVPQSVRGTALSRHGGSVPLFGKQRTAPAASVCRYLRPVPAKLRARIRVPALFTARPIDNTSNKARAIGPPAPATRPRGPAALARPPHWPVCSSSPRRRLQRDRGPQDTSARRVNLWIVLPDLSRVLFLQILSERRSVRRKVPCRASQIRQHGPVDFAAAAAAAQVRPRKPTRWEGSCGAGAKGFPKLQP